MIEGLRDPFRIEGYTVVENIYDGDSTAVYRCTDQNRNRPVIVKTLKNPFPTKEEISALRLEYEITRKVQLKEAVQAVAFAKCWNGFALVKEDTGGIPLRHRMREISGLADKLDIAVRVADIIGKLHDRGVIHKDINPGNLIVRPESGSVFLTDFGIATFLSVESSCMNPVNSTGGSLPYISPEQTGRMNRPVDFRSDLYSFGATLFELFTGCVPFSNTDPLETVHAHLAKSPPDPSHLNPEIPGDLSKVILKLLEKDPDDRYRSAIGVRWDIEECIRRLKSGEGFASFVPGKRDPSDTFHVSGRLYGRSGELELLHDVYRESARGRSTLLLVTGHSGIGKSSLIQEIHKPLTLSRGYFIQGKYDQYRKNIPYSALIQAFRELLRMMLTESDERISYWKEGMRSALGGNGRIITDVIPEATLIIGDNPPVSVLPAMETQNRFNHTLLSFIRVFSRKEHPLAIFLDDLQWADQASLSLMKHILTSTDKESLLFVGAYRSNEVDQSHPLMLAIDAMKKEGAKIHSIELKPIDNRSALSMIADTLECESGLGEEFAELAVQKTGGNPYFINLFLKSLHSEGLIFYNYEEMRWNWHIEKIRSAGITENVTNLMTDKLGRLPESSRSILQTAACVGNRFDLRTISLVTRITPETVAVQLREALQDGLIVPENDLYRFADAGVDLMEAKNIIYRFSHDRVQQAAYTTLPDVKRQELHLSIGKILNDLHDSANEEALIFDIANHMNQGISLLRVPTELRALAELNLTASIRSRECNAYGSALRYATTGIELLNRNHRESGSPLMFELHANGMIGALLSGEFEVMERLAEESLRFTESPAEKARIYEARIQGMIAQNRLYEGVQTALSALQMLGLRFSKNPGNLHVLASILKTAFMLRNRSTRSLLEMGEMEDPGMLAAMRVMTGVFSAAYISMPAMMPLFVLKQVQLSSRFGISPLSPFAFANYGLILAGILGKIPRGYEFGRLALDLVDRHDFRAIRTKTLFSATSFISHFREPLRDALPLLRTASGTGMETGDLEYASWCTLAISYTRFLCGDNLGEIEEEMEVLTETVSRLKQESVMSKNRLWRQAIRNLAASAEMENPDELTGDFYDEPAKILDLTESGQASEMAQLYLNKLMLAYHYGRFERAVRFSEEMKRFLPSVPGTPFVAHYHAFNALSRLALLLEGNREKRSGHLRSAKQSFRFLRKLMKFSPENISHFYELIGAELSRLNGNRKLAGERYGRAIASASKNGYLHVEAIAHERMGLLCLSGTDREGARRNLLTARQAYDLWGASGPVRRMNELYPALDSGSIGTLNEPSGEGRDRTRTAASLGSLDLQTILKASTAISGEIVLERLTEKLMRIAVENAGARSGQLFLTREGELRLVSSAYSGADGIIVHGTGEGLPASVNSVIKYVSRTSESVILSDAQADSRFAADPSLSRGRTKSVLCVPIVHLGKTIGILYLENDLMANAFTDERIELLHLLSGQIAVSINNALHYEVLEETVRARTEEIALQKKKSDDLLLNILPAETAEELKRDGRARVKKYDLVTVMFTDFKNFTLISEKMSPDELVAEIDTCFSAFDGITEKHGLEKIKTIGDSYMCAGGLPVANSTHPMDVTQAALDIRDYMNGYNFERKSRGLPYFEIRIGIHSGPVVAGVVGLKKFAYDIWGDTVNIASRIESAGEPGKVNVSGGVYELIKENTRCAYRGKIDVKNKGQIDMYFVDR